MHFSPGEVLKEIIKYREKNDEYLEHSRAFSRLRVVALSATIGGWGGYGWGGLREGVSLIYFLHLNKGFGTQRMSWSEVKFAR